MQQSPAPQKQRSALELPGRIQNILLSFAFCTSLQFILYILLLFTNNFLPRSFYSAEPLPIAIVTTIGFWLSWYIIVGNFRGNGLSGKLTAAFIIGSIFTGFYVILLAYVALMLLWA